MAKYFYTFEGKTLGPVNPNQVMTLILEDVLEMDSFVMDSRSPQWLKIRDIPELMHFLHESDVKISAWGDEKALAEMSDEDGPLFFNIPLAKLVWLSWLTLGLYEIYWLYVNWRFLRFNREGRTEAYFWKATLNPFALRRVFYQISRDEDLGGRTPDPDFTVNAWLWIFAWVFLGIRAVMSFISQMNVFADLAITFGTLGLSLFALVPVQKHINAGNAAAGRRLSPPTFGHYATIVVGMIGLATAFAI